MNFVQAIKSGFAHYLNCQGRAPRSEYWYWTLFTLLALLPLVAIDQLVIQHPLTRSGAGPLELCFNLLTFLPSFMVMIRRLHDVNRSGYWWLIALTVIGLIPLFYWSVKRGTQGPNRFGEDPLGA